MSRYRSQCWVSRILVETRLTETCIAGMVVSDSAHPTYLKPCFAYSYAVQICVVAPKWVESARCHFRFTALLFAVYGPFTAYLYWSHFEWNFESGWNSEWRPWIFCQSVARGKTCDEICSWVCIHCDDIGATLHNSIWSYCSFKLHNSIIYWTYQILTGPVLLQHTSWNAN